LVAGTFHARLARFTLALPSDRALRASVVRGADTSREHRVDACSTNFLVQEANIDLKSPFLKEPIAWEDGYILPPTKPGLGVELNEELVERSSEVVSSGRS